MFSLINFTFSAELLRYLIEKILIEKQFDVKKFDVQRFDSALCAKFYTYSTEKIFLTQIFTKNQFLFSVVFCCHNFLLSSGQTGRLKIDGFRIHLPGAFIFTKDEDWFFTIFFWIETKHTNVWIPTIGNRSNW